MNAFSWYFTGLTILLLVGQHFLLGISHREAVTRLTMEYQQKLEKVAQPQPAHAAAAAAALAPATVTATPAAAETAVARQSQEAAAPSQIAAASPASSRPLPAVPVSLAFRSQPFKKGKIVLVSNTSKRKLAYNVSVTRPSTGASRRFVVNVAPSAEIRLAGSEIWAFASGDELEIALSGFESKLVAIP